MSVLQPSYGPRDPNERSCRTCRSWDGDRSSLADRTRTGSCSMISDGELPPYFAEVFEALEVQLVTTAKDSCSFHDYASGR